MGSLFVAGEKVIERKRRCTYDWLVDKARWWTGGFVFHCTLFREKPPRLCFFFLVVWESISDQKLGWWGCESIKKKEECREFCWHVVCEDLNNGQPKTNLAQWWAVWQTTCRLAVALVIYTSKSNYKNHNYKMKHLLCQTHS